MATPPNPYTVRRDKTIRIVTIVAMIPALCLLIPSGVVTGNAFPALGLIPMGFSFLVSATALGSKKQDSYVRRIVPGADFTAATFLMVFMVISFVMMAADWDLEARNAMLCSYGLVPLMVNFTIHAYLALRYPSILFQPRPCPNCNHIPPSALPRWRRSQRHVALPVDASPTVYHPPAQTQGHVHTGGPGHSRSSKEIYAPFMHSYGDGDVDADAEARESSEFQTSGFNTPRQSAETLRSEVREGVVEGKGKDAAESLV